LCVNDVTESRESIDQPEQRGVYRKDIRGIDVRHHDRRFRRMEVSHGITVQMSGDHGVPIHPSTAPLKHAVMSRGT
jgi:hypothetical protein